MWLLGISLPSSTNLLEILVIYFSQKSCKVFLMSQIFVACPAEVPLSSLPPFVFGLFRFLFFFPAQSTFHCEALTAVSCPVPPYSAMRNLHVTVVIFNATLPLSQLCFLSSILPLRWTDLTLWWFRDWEILGPVCFYLLGGYSYDTRPFCYSSVLGTLTSSSLLSIVPSSCGVKIQL